MTTRLPTAGLGAPQRRSSLLFHWRAVDLSLRALSGQQGTLTRASRGLARDSFGSLYSAAHSAPRWHVLGGNVGLLIEGSSTNLLIRASDFSNAAWGKANITVTQDAVRAPDGSLTADKVAATATAATVMTQGAAIIGTLAFKQVWCRQGSGPTDFNAFLLYNTTTSTSLASATLDYSTGVLTVAIGNGYVEAFLGGWYRVTLWSTASIVSGNTVTCYVGVTGGAVTAGKYAYFWGADLKLFPSFHIPTVAATVTQAADDLVFPFAANPQSLTLYERHVDLGSQITGNASLYELGAWGTPPALTVYHPTATTIGATYHNGAVQASTGTVAAGTVIGDLIETVVTFSVDPVTSAVVVGFAVSRNGAAVNVAAPSASIAMASVFQNQILRLNSRAGTAFGSASFQSLKIAAGVRTLAQMQAAY